MHTVRAGDTLWGIARTYGVTVPELAAANGIDTQTRLALGARLTVPASAESYRARRLGRRKTTRMTYRVKRGDTLSQIAERFHVTVRQLMGWNDLRSRLVATRRATPDTLRRPEPLQRRLTWVFLPASAP